ncbi:MULTISPECIES: hypothetical protein [Haloarcula]|uniref:hypothetical protein n=1 Tax=Haloarcula TaxID=2237 RepID=UPI0023E79E0A|nr:hypothetical protein [Halomicroarcula sp. SHR3]
MSDDDLSATEVVRRLAPLVRFVDTLTEFARNPRRFIFGFISTYLVATALGFGEYLVSSILLVFDTVAGYFRGSAILLVTSLQTVTTPILGAGRVFTNAVATTVMAAGPLGPPIGAALTALLLYATYRLLIAVIGELPLGSSLVDLLGLR